MIPPDMGPKAIEAVAKTAGKMVDAASAAGSYLAGTLGTIPQDFLGVAGGDWLHHKRRRNLAKLEADTAAILDRIDRDRWIEPSISVVVPLLQAAADESREELQALWAQLLAAAMTDGGRRVRRAFFDVLQKLEPIDALVLSCFDPRRVPKSDVNQSAIALGVTKVQLSLARRSVRELELIDQYGAVTAFGQEFFEVCVPAPRIAQAA